MFELFPGGLQTGIHGRLHHVSLDFTYTSLAATYNNSRPGWDLLQGRLTDFGVSLEMRKKVPYTAVSYVWGTGDLSHVVKLPGHDLHVTATVDTILRRLRNRTRPTYLWIDQICIDQTNLDDKSSQVQLMGTIYARARNTIAWLGDESDHGALRALQGLSEATMGRDEDLLEDELEYLRHPLNEEKDSFDNLLNLSNRPWFQRTWIVQEAILSRSLFLMIGLDTVYWDDFGGHCMSVDHLDLFEDPDRHVRGLRSIQKSGLRVAAELRPVRDMHFGLNAIESLFNWLLTTRSAAVTNPLDKVYGVLGLCTSSIVPDYTRSKEDLFYEVTADAIAEAHDTIVKRANVDKNLSVVQHHLTRILDSVDHDPELSRLPSWVVDWSLPRRTISLALSTSVLSLYKAGGSTRNVVCDSPNENARLRVRAAFFDTIIDVSWVFVDVSLTNQDPTQQNPSLKEAVSFVNDHDLAKLHDFWEIFCTTLVAGKDRSGMNEFPRDYLEIFSLLCDETTDQRPSIPGQTYTPRQSKGHFLLDHLSKRKPGRGGR